jgi:hypothetical protein
VRINTQNPLLTKTFFVKYLPLHSQWTPCNITPAWPLAH